MTMAITATAIIPPITPPAIAPALLPPLLPSLSLVPSLSLSLSLPNKYKLNQIRTMLVMSISKAYGHKLMF